MTHQRRLASSVSAVPGTPPQLPQRDPGDGAWLLRDYPGDAMRVDCPKCGRAGSCRKAALVARFGPQAGMPEVLDQFAVNCERRGAVGQHGDPCRAGFPGLVRLAAWWREWRERRSGGPA